MMCICNKQQQEGATEHNKLENLRPEASVEDERLTGDR